MDLQLAIGKAKEEGEEALRRFFDEKKTETQRIDKNLLPIVDQVADFTLRGGKRLRAFLVWLGHRSVIPAHAGIQSIKDWIPDQVGDDALLHAMMALELFHSFALIHDDIMDEDRQRRHGPAVHEFFRINAVTHQRITPRNAKHFGTSMAILAGDLTLVWADEMMGETIWLSLRGSRVFRERRGNLGIASPASWRARNDTKAWEIYQHMKEEVIFGQTMDVINQSGVRTIGRDTINELKTAWYSVVRPLQIGAALAGADERHLTRLADFGVPVGKLFQLRDDAMDGEVDTAALKRESKRLTAEAMAALEKLTVTDETRPLFAELIQFVTQRTS